VNLEQVDHHAGPVGGLVLGYAGITVIVAAGHK
jgi:hypothetical protein